MTKLKLGLAAGAAAILAFGVAACGQQAAEAPATVEEAADATTEAADDAAAAVGDAAAAAGDAVEGAVNEGAEAVAAATDDKPAEAAH